MNVELENSLFRRVAATQRDIATTDLLNCYSTEDARIRATSSPIMQFMPDCDTTHDGSAAR